MAAPLLNQFPSLVFNPNSNPRFDRLRRIYKYGVLAVTLAFCFLPDEHDQRVVHRELDMIGFFLLSPGLVLFLYGSEHLAEHTGMAALRLSIILFVAFFGKALRDRERALIDLRLFRSRSFSARH
jgi:hypothetical protein